MVLLLYIDIFPLEALLISASGDVNKFHSREMSVRGQCALHFLSLRVGGAKPQ